MVVETQDYVVNSEQRFCVSASFAILLVLTLCVETSKPGRWTSTTCVSTQSIGTRRIKIESNLPINRLNNLWKCWVLFLNPIVTYLFSSGSFGASCLWHWIRLMYWDDTNGIPEESWITIIGIRKRAYLLSGYRCLLQIPRASPLRGHPYYSNLYFRKRIICQF